MIRRNKQLVINEKKNINNKKKVIFSSWHP